ncbi:SufE family protein [Planctomyces sp. SH-PL14]|uniref:SufE family protein n=1 Tax=Planctomyces sp. SH-PL14 TaxID=1632864 RepID=UPI001E3B2771|nr:SufE family protein [Planctomyces sp. SH-PL14]
MSTLSAMTLDELIQEFDDLGDWEARCDFLIDLGKELPKLDPVNRTEENRVHGCQSNVWLVAEIHRRADGEPEVEFVANSDAMIVSGLIAVLSIIYNHHTPAEILATDITGIFKRLELDRHLSPQRRNGLFGMVKRVREIAAHA